MKIKPLIWEPIDVGECLEGTGDYYLCHQAGRYWIHRKASGDLRGPDGKVAFYDDRDDAKDATQTDHERRISAWVAAPRPLSTSSGEDRAAIVEACAKVAEGFTAYRWRGHEGENTISGMFARGNARAAVKIAAAIRKLSEKPE